VESLIDHFENGVAWEDTGIFQLTQFRINHGKDYRGCSSTHEIHQHLRRYDRIYIEMSAKGYKHQGELPNDNGRKFLGFGKPKLDRQPYLNEIGVSIDRNGEFLW